MVATQDVTLFNEDGIEVSSTNPLSIQITDGYNIASVTSGGKLKVDVAFTPSASQQIQVTSSTGTSTDVGFDIGSEQSIPCVISDYENPTYRLNINSNGILTASVSNFPSTQTINGTVTVQQNTNSNLKADVTSNAQNIATETTIGNIYTRQNNKTQYSRLTDATTDVDVDVRGTDANGLNVLPLGEYRTALPTLTNGQVAPLQVDATGKLLTSTVNPSRKTIELNVTGSYGLLVANMWRNYLSYIIPAGYRYELIAYSTSCANTGGSSRINKVISLGDYNIGTNTFTDGSAYTVPEFCAGIEAEITTVLSATPVTLTITYINQAGVAGRTGTIGPITASSAVGTRFAMTLQAGDYGITDVTAVARSAAPTGVVRLYGLTNLFYHKNDNAEYTYITTTARESLILNAGDIVQLDIFNTVVGAQVVVNKAVGILTPT
jgi:hypothetical protein